MASNSISNTIVPEKQETKKNDNSGLSLKGNFEVKTAKVEAAAEAAKTTAEVVKTPVPVTATATPVEEVKQESDSVSKLEKLLKNYEAAVRKQTLTGYGRFDSIAVMISICEYLNRTTDPAVFDHFFRYFQRHQNDNMYYDVALFGIHTIQNRSVKTLVSSTHACYLELCRVRSLRKASFKYTINAMKLMCISETQGKWLIAKSQTRS